MKNVNVNAPRKIGGRPMQIVAGVVVALVLFGGGYALGAGRAPAPATTIATASANPAGGQGRGGGGAGGRNLVNGQIISVNADSITITVRQGGTGGASGSVTTQIVLVGGGTRVVRTSETDIKLSDLKVGDTITVAGTPDTTSGTTAAQAIIVGGTNILGDILGGGGGGGGSPRPAGTGSPRPSATR